ncbi:glycosyltransferase [Arthrospira sp. O9.13F]|nr:glycosyltransferase [Arthrospira sp. O9.13F]
MKLSFCIIAKNEAHQLGECLQTVGKLVDEMIVVDTGSRDGTPEVAKNMGARVYEFSWCDDFAAARNAGLKYVTGDWVLVLDADERLRAGIIPKIRSLINQEDYLLINLVRQEIGAVQSPYSLVSRLFRNHPDLYFSRPYHALVDDSVMEILRREPDWRIGSIPEIAIAHYGYSTDAIAARNKQQRACQAMESYFKQHPDDPYLASKLGALYVQLGKLSAGIDLLEKGLKQASGIEGGTMYELHYHLGIAYSKRGQLEAAEAQYKKAIAVNVFPQLKIGAYNNLGNLLKERGHLKGAQSAYETTIEIDPLFSLGYYNLGMTLRAMGNSQKAIASYQKAISLNPHHGEAYQNLGAALLGIGNIPDSLKAFQTAISLYEQTNPHQAKLLKKTLSEMGWRI